MTQIFIEGLGNVEISGNVPTKEEEQAIIQQLQSSEDSLATDTITPEMVTPSLGDEPKLQGLEFIGGRPTFEATGALAGGIPGTVAGGLPGSVAGGTLGIISITAGANATRVGKYADVGTSDVRMLLTNTNTGTGTGFLTIRYIQNNNLS